MYNNDCLEIITCVGVNNVGESAEAVVNISSISSGVGTFNRGTPWTQGSSVGVY